MDRETLNITQRGYNYESMRTEDTGTEMEEDGVTETRPDDTTSPAVQHINKSKQLLIKQLFLYTALNLNDPKIRS